MEQLRKKVDTLLEGKKYIDYITAAMSVPILITVLVTNVSNFTNKKTDAAQHEEKISPTRVITEVVKIVPVKEDAIETKLASTPTSTPIASPSSTITSPTPTHTQSAACIKKIGPVSITSPKENETIEDEPVCIDIAHNSDDYCSVVWSYRVNGSEWSAYTDKAICLFNMSSGAKHLEVRIKSVASDDDTTIERNFIYKGKENSPTPTPAITHTDSVASSSATVTITPSPDPTP